MREKEFGYHDSGPPGPEEESDEVRRLRERKRGKSKGFVAAENLPSPELDPLEQLIAGEENEEGDDDLAVDDSGQSGAGRKSISKTSDSRHSGGNGNTDKSRNSFKPLAVREGVPSGPQRNPIIGHKEFVKGNPFGPVRNTGHTRPGHKSRRNFGRIPKSKDIARGSIRREG